SLDYLPDGSYHVHLDVPSGYHLSTPAQGYASISVASGRSGSSVNFGIAPNGSPPLYPFHNYANANDVGNDGFIAANDALAIINYINSHEGEGEISAQDPHLIGYIDVVPDGFCAPNDVLAVVNWINSHPNGEGAPPSTPGGGSGGDSGDGEGELTVRVPTPTSAADYYAQGPIHFDNLPDAVPDLDAQPAGAFAAPAKTDSTGLPGWELAG